MSKISTNLLLDLNCKICGNLTKSKKIDYEFMRFGLTLRDSDQNSAIRPIAEVFIGARSRVQKLALELFKALNQSNLLVHWVKNCRKQKNAKKFIMKILRVSDTISLQYIVQRF